MSFVTSGSNSSSAPRGNHKDSSCKKKLQEGGVGPSSMSARNAHHRPLKEVSSNKPVSSQPSLIGKSGFLQISNGSKSSKVSFTVFADENSTAAKPLHQQKKAGSSSSSSPPPSASKLVQTDLFGDAESVDFYKDLAEKRREALDESLKENESLVVENEELRFEVDELKATNESLQETVDKAKKMAKMLAPLLDDDDQEQAAAAEPAQSEEDDESGETGQAAA